MMLRQKVTISQGFTPEQLSALTDASYALRVPRNEVVRRAVDEWLKRHAKDLGITINKQKEGQDNE